MVVYKSITEVLYHSSIFEISDLKLLQISLKRPGTRNCVDDKFFREGSLEILETFLLASNRLLTVDEFVVKKLIEYIIVLHARRMTLYLHRALPMHYY